MALHRVIFCLWQVFLLQSCPLRGNATANLQAARHWHPDDWTRSTLQNAAGDWQACSKKESYWPACSLVYTHRSAGSPVYCQIVKKQALVLSSDAAPTTTLRPSMLCKCRRWRRGFCRAPEVNWGTSIITNVCMSSACIFDLIKRTQPGHLSSITQGDHSKQHELLLSTLRRGSITLADHCPAVAQV